MTVQELIDRLEECDPTAEVKLMIQPSWPFEYEVSGLVARSDFQDGTEDSAEPEKKPNDLFLLEGRQLCYGSRKAWDAC